MRRAGFVPAFIALGARAAQAAVARLSPPRRCAIAARCLAVARSQRRWSASCSASSRAATVGGRAGRVGRPARPRPRAYIIDATLDPAARTIAGTVEMRLTNTTRAPLGEVALVLYPNRFAAPDPGVDDVNRPFVYPREEFVAGRHHGRQLEVRTEPPARAGARAPERRGRPPARSGSKRSAASRRRCCARRLPAPLAPGATATVRARFRTVLPERYGPFGVADGRVDRARRLVPGAAGARRRRHVGYRHPARVRRDVKGHLRAPTSYKVLRRRDARSRAAGRELRLRRAGRIAADALRRRGLRAAPSRRRPRDRRARRAAGAARLRALAAAAASRARARRRRAHPARAARRRAAAVQGHLHRRGAAPPRAHRARRPEPGGDLRSHAARAPAAARVPRARARAGGLRGDPVGEHRQAGERRRHAVGRRRGERRARRPLARGRASAPPHGLRLDRAPQRPRDRRPLRVGAEAAVRARVLSGGAPRLRARATTARASAATARPGRTIFTKLRNDIGAPRVRPDDRSLSRGRRATAASFRATAAAVAGTPLDRLFADWTQPYPEPLDYAPRRRRAERAGPADARRRETAATPSASASSGAPRGRSARPSRSRCRATATTSAPASPGTTTARAPTSRSRPRGGRAARSSIPTAACSRTSASTTPCRGRCRSCSTAPTSP